MHSISTNSMIASHCWAPKLSPVGQGHRYRLYRYILYIIYYIHIYYIIYIYIIYIYMYSILIYSKRSLTFQAKVLCQRQTWRAFPRNVRPYFLYIGSTLIFQFVSQHCLYSRHNVYHSPAVQYICVHLLCMHSFRFISFLP